MAAHRLAGGRRDRYISWFVETKVYACADAVSWSLGTVFASANLFDSLASQTCTAP
jgi:hypothetical protein